jgi:HEPN domain-containing protein
MGDAKQELVQNWLSKARRDLDSAIRLASGSKPLLDTAIFHCQQSAEKALKGWLAYHDQRFEKTHDVRMLVTLAAAQKAEFTNWFDAAETLTPYATAYRYPGETLEPTRSEFESALQMAQGFYQYIVSCLPPEVHPS